VCRIGFFEIVDDGFAAGCGKIGSFSDHFGNDFLPRFMAVELDDPPEAVAHGAFALEDLFCRYVVFCPVVGAPLA